MGATMHVFRFLLLPAAFILFSTGIAPAQRVGDTVRGYVQLETGIAAKIQVPLPEGDWLAVSRSVARSSVSNVPIIQSYLVQVSANRALQRAIFIETNYEFPNYGWNVPRECNRSDVFYREPSDTRGFGGDRGYKCLTVNHIQMTTSAKSSQASKDAYAWVWAHTTGMPTTLIGATYDISDGKRFLRVTYFRNPEADGFAPPRDSSWRSSDWHKDRLPGDPKKLAYMNDVKAWALQWKARVEAGFGGKLAVR